MSVQEPGSVPPADTSPLATPATGSGLDRWWARTMTTPLRMALWHWGAPGLVVVLAAFLRLWNLGQPDSLVFDETFYVKDAYTTLQLGYEATWPDKADEQFAEGNVDIHSSEASFAVHPPLGKWIIALGMLAFGGGNPVGWRIAVALCGILLVVVTMLLAKRLFRSTALTVIAGFLLAIEGNAIVMSRVALLDGIFALLALMGAGAILLDREWHQRRLYERLVHESGINARHGFDTGKWGPALWWRPWVIVAGVLFGLASSVKWSGLYFLAAFGVYLIVVDALARRSESLERWAPAALVKQGPITFLLYVPIAAVTYLATWSGWLLSSTGMYRQWAQTEGEPWSGALSWVPLWAQNLWHLESAVYNYHVNEHSEHPYSAAPQTWLLLIRPTQMYYSTLDKAEAVCGNSPCVQNITGVANPIIWWASVAALAYLIYRFARKPEWTTGFILMGMVAGYVPWLLYLDRTVYQFYTIAFEPYLILALVFAISQALGSPTDPEWMRLGGIRAVAVFLIVCALVTVFFLPLWTGMLVPQWFVQLHYWMPTWL